jgi:hypothetical protein
VVEELDVVGDDLDGATLLTFLVGERPILQSSLDVDEPPFGDVLADGLGELIPADDCVEVRRKYTELVDPTTIAK